MTESGIFGFETIRNNTALKLAHGSFPLSLCFETIRNNTALKQQAYKQFCRVGFETIRNNTALKHELTGEALRPYLQNLVKVQTIYAMTIFRTEDIKPAMYQKELVHNATPDVLVNYWMKNLDGGKNTAKVYQAVRTLAELNSLDYDLLVYDTFFDQQEEREAETLSGAWSKLVQSVKKYFAF